MESGSWKVMSLAHYIISFLVWFVVKDAAGASSCSVTPSAVAVFAGNNVSLTCTAYNDRINRWIRGRLNDDSVAVVVYRAADKSGTVNVTGILVDGYMVDESVTNQIILTMKNASIVQADRYYCGCSYSSSNYNASVTVLVSKPTFSSSSQITDGQPVTLTCSMSLNGTAAAWIAITDINGGQVRQDSKPGAYPSSSSDLQVISLNYNITANSTINQTYSCQVNLTDASILIYSEQVVTSVLWTPVRNATIVPVDKDRCSSVGQCAFNQTILCEADGNPNPVLFQWTFSLNGSSFSENTSGQLTLNQIGHYKIQCTAFNSIGGINYNNTSEYFKTEVTVAGPPVLPNPASVQDDERAMQLGLGLGLGLGLLIIIVLVIVIIIFCYKRKKSRTVCCNPADKETKNNQSVELSKKHNGNTDNGAKKNDHSTGVPNKGFENNDETTLVENDLYSRNQSTQKTQIDPSDGGYASVNEVIPRGK